MKKLIKKEKKNIKYWMEKKRKEMACTFGSSGLVPNETACCRDAFRPLMPKSYSPCTEL